MASKSSSSLASVSSGVSVGSAGSPLTPSLTTAVESLPSASERTPLANLTRSSSLPLEGDIPGSAGSSMHANEADVQIIVEALKSKDRLYVLKLGELMEGLIKDRRLRVDLQPATTYQRLLVHRCSAYYRLRPETDTTTKGIFVVPTPESKIPSIRLCELVPAETTPLPAFKIMARNGGARRSKPTSQAGSTTGEDAESSDIESSEAWTPGLKNGNGAKKRPTIEEREAAYNEARSRIFMDFEEKEKERAASASSSTQSLVSGSGSTNEDGVASSASEAGRDDISSSPTTESEWSAPAFREKERDRKPTGSRRTSGNASVASSSSRSLRSTPFTPSSASSSSRGSRASSPAFTYASIHEPPAQAMTSPYDPAYGHQMPPPGMYSGPSYGGTYYYPPPGGHHMMQYPYYPYPPPVQTHSDPNTPAQNPDVYAHPQPHPVPYPQTHYGWPPPPAGPPSAHQPVHPAQSPVHPQHPISPSGPPPHHAQKDATSPGAGPYPPYMAPPYMYPTPGYPGHPLPGHPTPPGPYGQNVPHQPMYEMPRSDPNGYNRHGDVSGRGGHGHQMYGHGQGNMSGSSSNSSVSHSRASSRSSMSSGMTHGHGNTNGNGKGWAGPMPPTNRQPWSYGPGIGASGHHNGGSDAVGPRLSSRRMSGTSMASSHGGRSSAGDEASSTASSSTSSSSRRTYTSTASSQHPLPPRPDWAVGLKPQPTLASHNHHGRQHDHISTNSSRNMSPISPSRNLHASPNGTSHPRGGPQPALHSTDFPPLSGSDQEKEKRTPVAGAWTNPSSIRSVLTPPKPQVNGQGGSAVTNHSMPMVNRNQDDPDQGFERPPSKGTQELFNPKATRRPQAPSVEDVEATGTQASDGAQNQQIGAPDVSLSRQVEAISLEDAANATDASGLQP
ncbi:hypothetical protein HGRIS_004946 [Hohenbuehelia grisea]|uniref:SUZ domain-containing protein n=1 Tax=Hohenbuehelia grisea TaxID=104357 RepID=A0ABR3JDP8_9AGAR